MNNSTNSTRNGSIDLLRILAAVAIIIIHTVTAPVNAYSGSLSTELTDRLNSIHNLMMWAVPVFFIITGYCCGLRQECDYRYCFRKVQKFIAVLFTVGFFFALLERIFTDGGFAPVQVLLCIMDIFTGNVWAHLWYVYAAIGIYLVLPALYAIMKKKGDALIFLVILFLFTILLPWIAGMTGFLINLYFSFCNYVFYVCFGLFCSDPLTDAKVQKFIVPLCSILFVLCAVFLAIAKRPSEYTDPFVCIMAVSIFAVILSCRVKNNKALSLTASCTFGIYLLHPFFINLALKLFKLDLLTSYAGAKLALFCFSLLVLSMFTVIILKKIPGVRSLF